MNRAISRIQLRVTQDAAFSKGVHKTQSIVCLYNGVEYGQKRNKRTPNKFVAFATESELFTEKNNAAAPRL